MIHKHIIPKFLQKFSMLRHTISKFVLLSNSTENLLMTLCWSVCVCIALKWAYFLSHIIWKNFVNYYFLSLMVSKEFPTELWTLLIYQKSNAFWILIFSMEFFEFFVSVFVLNCFCLLIMLTFQSIRFDLMSMNILYFFPVILFIIHYKNEIHWNIENECIHSCLVFIFIGNSNALNGKWWKKF